MRNSYTSEQDAEVIDFNEAVENKHKLASSGDGFDYFPGMVVGTRFVTVRNGSYNSLCDEYILLQKSGVSVLLLNVQVNPKVHWAAAEERHLSKKFWKYSTLVQILHIPDASETGPPPPSVEGRTTNGKSPKD